MSRHLLPATLLITFIITGCGPAQTARDQEDEQEQQYVREQSAKLSPLEGCYKGYMRPNRNKGTTQVRMQLHLITDTVIVPGRNKYVESPTLFGNVTTLPEGEVFANFNKSVMNSYGHLVSSSTAPSSGTSQEPGTPTIDIAPSKKPGRWVGLLYGRGLITKIHIVRAKNDDDCIVSAGDVKPEPAPSPICKPCGPAN